MAMTADEVRARFGLPVAARFLVLCLMVGSAGAAGTGGLSSARAGPPTSRRWRRHPRDSSGAAAAAFLQTGGERRRRGDAASSPSPSPAAAPPILLRRSSPLPRTRGCAVSLPLASRSSSSPTKRSRGSNDDGEGEEEEGCRSDEDEINVVGRRRKGARGVSSGSSSGTAESDAEGEKKKKTKRATKGRKRQSKQQQQQQSKADAVPAVQVEAKKEEPRDDDEDDGDDEEREMEERIAAIVDRKIRAAQAQAKIDRILTGPDAPIDVDREFEKVIAMDPPPVASSSSVAAAADTSAPSNPLDGGDRDDRGDGGGDDAESSVERLERELYAAVRRSDYGAAAHAKREIGRLTVDDYGAVLQVNAAFYRAFSNKDYDSMESVWLHDESVTCIHPSHVPLVGAVDVLSSWRRMFRSSNQSFQKNWIDPVDIRVTIKGASTSIVSCTENVYARRFVRGRQRKTELLNQLVTTNIFRKLDDQWYLVHHHSSWHANSNAAKYALQRGSGGDGAVASASHGMDASSQTRVVLRPSANGNNDNDRDDDDDDDDAGAGGGTLGMDGILGMNNFGPILGGSSSSASSSSPEGQGGPGRPQVRRIFMGNINDILGGNLGDILSSSSSSSPPGDHGQGGAAGSSSSSNPMSVNGGFGGGFGNQSDGNPITSFNPIDGEDDDDDDDVDQVEIDSDDDDEEDGEGNEAVSLIKQWAESADSGSITVTELPNGAASTATAASSGNASANGNGGAGGGAPKDALRQNCITALRGLCGEGAITADQKRVLLTDIITCSARGEFSMVEVAYELLCGEGDDKDAAEEEFADQCRVFARSLPSSSTPSPPSSSSTS